MALFKEYSPQIVVSDWEMPGGTGVDLCRQIPSRASASPVHFIMLTFHSEKQMVLEAYAAGVNDFVTKPYHGEELLARVKAGLRVSEMNCELAHKTERLLATNSQLKVMNARLDRLSTTDELTGLNNRRRAMVRLEEQWTLAERYGSSLSVAAVDIDHFKKVNDTHGHEAGDAVLRQTAGILRECTRRSDIVCRMGGEKFLIIFPCQTREDAVRGAQRCRRAVERHTFCVNDLELKETISAGVATRTAETGDWSNLLRMADKALYRAKNGGRNTVMTIDVQEASPGAAADCSVRTVAADPGADGLDAAHKGVDMNLITSRCGGDARFAKSILNRFKTPAPSELNRMEAALAVNDRIAFGRAAHTLKSMAAYVTADTAAELCRQMETAAKSDEPLDAKLVSRLRGEIDHVTAWIAKRAAADSSAQAA